MDDLKGKILFSLALIAFIIIPGFTMDYKTITMQVDGEDIQFVTAKGTVGEVLDYKGIRLQPYDYISESLDTLLTPGMAIEIKKAFPIIIEADSRAVIEYATANTVANILVQAGIEMGELDRVMPQMDTKVVQPKRILVSRVVEQTEVVKEIIPRETVHNEDFTLYRGVTKVVEEGSDGEKELIYQVTLVDGQEEERVLLEETILAQSISREIAMGMRTVGSVSRSGTSMTMVATAYTHTGNRTFTGIWPHVGVVAVDPSVIPLGTRMYIVGYGYATAADTGGVIKGNKIDVFKDTRQEAINWGRRTVRVYILD